MYHHQESLGHLTGLASRLFNKLITTRFKEAGIEMTAEQWGVVVILRNHPPLTQGEVGELLYLEKSSVSRSIAGLEKRGWIERCAAEDDSRKKMVLLTPKALEVAERCSNIAESVLQDAHQGLTHEQLQQNRMMLVNVIDSLRAQVEP